MDPRRRPTARTPATCTYSPHRTTARTYTPVTPGHHPRGFTIALPVDFSAFCELHHTHYTHYARLRLDPPAADHAVQATFGDLAIRWTRILRGNPAAWAWHTLNHHITGALPPTRTNPEAPPARTAFDRLRTHLPDHLADITALHYALGLTTDQIADVIGTDPATAAYHLRTADRHLTTLTPPPHDRLPSPSAA